VPLSDFAERVESILVSFGDPHVSVGRFACNSCKDIDLCPSCFTKYDVDELKDVMKSCGDHHFII
jgi:hypothetical protein